MLGIAFGMVDDIAHDFHHDVGHDHDDDGACMTLSYAERQELLERIRRVRVLLHFERRAEPALGPMCDILNVFADVVERVVSTTEVA